jgi:putative peptidoglycan lipid II flippase
VLATASIFLMHSLGLVFIAANRVITPVFYAQKDAKSPMYAGIVSFVVNTASAWVLSRVMGGNGIALALSIASVVNTIFLLIMLFRRHIPGMNKALREIFLYSIKMLAFSAPAGACAWLTQFMLRPLTAHNTNRLIFAGLPLVASALVFIGIGFGLLLLTKDPIALFIIGALRNRRAPKEKIGSSDDKPD